ncbi:hypothetical protein [Modestobacter italicus]|uniref:hypothetical protein n=1 Tax=Modestobacter italicus (strain DSM 44449 / CECT 9708 / BC 501) TaxID=2732864 RepID=UPI001C939781|nr:hypothetical protein [Modestobacter italicus]
MELLQISTGYLDLLDRYGVPWVELRTTARADPLRGRRPGRYDTVPPPPRSAPHVRGSRRPHGAARSTTVVRDDAPV